MLNKIGQLKFFFKDPDKKGFFKMFKEMTHYGWIKKELPTDYFRKFLYRKEVINYNNFLSLKQYRSIIRSKKMVFSEIFSILDNKLSLSYYFESHNLPIPKLISYNLKNHFFFNDTISIINSIDDVLAFFTKVFESSGEEQLFLKFLDANGGRGCILLKKDELQEQIKSNEAILLNNSFVHQQVIIQHPDINKIFSRSINTLRIDTYIDRQNNIHILSVLMRFGIGKNIVDNTGSGGFSISVNMKSGRLQGVGRKDFVKGAQIYLKHPDTNMELNNFKLPFFTEACELAKKASKYLPNRIVGWDIAISKNGPVIIEGNHSPSLHITDVAYGGYCAHPLIKEILNNI